MLILPALLAQSCATTALHTEVAQYNPCTGWKKIMLDHRDAMADADKHAIINHDCYGYKLGCWTMPPSACRAKP